VSASGRVGWPGLAGIAFGGGVGLGGGGTPGAPEGMPGVGAGTAGTGLVAGGVVADAEAGALGVGAGADPAGRGATGAVGRPRFRFRMPLPPSVGMTFRGAAGAEDEPVRAGSVGISATGVGSDSSSAGASITGGAVGACGMTAAAGA